MGGFGSSFGAPLPALTNARFQTFGDGSAGAVTYGTGTTNVEDVVQATTIVVDADAVVTTATRKGVFLFATESITIRGVVHADGRGAAGATSITTKGADGFGLGGYSSNHATTPRQGGAQADYLAIRGYLANDWGDATLLLGGAGGGASGSGAKAGAGGGSYYAGGDGFSSGGVPGTFNDAGGAGGGIVFLAAPRIIIEDGAEVRAEGLDGTRTGASAGSGGGGGGIVWVVAKRFTESGSISVKGGDGGGDDSPLSGGAGGVDGPGGDGIAGSGDRDGGGGGGAGLIRRDVVR